MGPKVIFFLFWVSEAMRVSELILTAFTHLPRNRKLEVKLAIAEIFTYYPHYNYLYEDILHTLKTTLMGIHAS
jgi:hypothetical protein